MDYKINEIEYEIAKKYPRDINEFKIKVNKILELANTDDIYYKIPRKDKNNKIFYVEGLSIRFAEIIISNYKNIKIFSGKIKEDEKTITSQCLIIDLENNTTIQTEVVKSIIDKNGKKYGNELITLVINSSISIAIRSAINKIIPTVILNDIVNNLKSKIIKKINENFDDVKKSILEYFNSIGVDENKIIKYFDLGNINELNKDNLEILIGIKNSIINNEIGINIFDEYENKKNENLNFERIKNAINYFKKLGISEKELFNYLNINSELELTNIKLNELAKLYSFISNNFKK